MESKKLVYINGHFYEKESKRRINIQPNVEVCMVASSTVFLYAEPVGNSIKVRSSESQHNAIKNDTEVKDFKKIFDRGQMLYVKIAPNHEFQIELLEEMYFYLTPTSKKNEGRLYDSACVVRKNTTGSLQYFEEIYGKSLNEVYKRTFIHYFGNNRNPSCNAINRFYEKANGKEVAINQYRYFTESDK